MFWGSFAGRRKGPSFIWPKEFGGINGQKYTREIVPLVRAFHERHGPIIFQQDNAPGHRARVTQEAFQQAGIEVLRWPAYSPDLAAIENVWPWLMEEMEARCEDIQELGEAELQPLIQAGWEAIPEAFLLTLAHSMPRRLQMCVEAEGATIKY
jgi:transposase